MSYISHHPVDFNDLSKEGIKMDRQSKTLNEERNTKDRLQDFGPAQILQTLGLVLLAFYLFLSEKFGESDLWLKVTILAAEACMVVSLFLLFKNRKKLTRLTIGVIAEFAVTTILMLMLFF